MINKTKEKKLIEKNNGMTLIEIVISVTVLSIITVAFFTIFLDSYTTVFSTGQKNKVVSEVASKMEILYSVNDIGAENLDFNDLLAITTNVVSTTTDLYTNPGEGILNLCIIPFEQTGTDIDGYKVTLVKFYQNGQKYVELTSFLKVRGVP